MDKLKKKREQKAERKRIQEENVKKKEVNNKKRRSDDNDEEEEEEEQKEDEDLGWYEEEIGEKPDEKTLHKGPQKKHNPFKFARDKKAGKEGVTLLGKRKKATGDPKYKVMSKEELKKISKLKKK